ncbi:homologous-pairing protein 2 homolog [Ostrinia furnacalis]|uniref:homologous-pairing protein 2 homolog n=1 Tax=Ostrinia furnacalis TaxID=93504 RepID=UPI001038A2CC|nr:homologous-pairing protein 2 homolog [Ostrinia furnacalis]
MASEAILKYLVDTNRPYSCADVTVNLRGAYTKTVVQKNLDALAESGKIKCKLYGKQKVYAAIQLDNQEAENDVEDYDALFKTLTETLAEKSNGLKAAETTLKTLTSAPTTTSAKSQIAEARTRIESLEAKLGTLRNSTEVLSADEKATIMNAHDTMLREYRKRKRICSDILEAILEGYPKTKKTLLDELCIETDEMVDFKLMSN